jgi:hypothetical protein
MTNPADDLLRISMSHSLPRCLHAVAELGIADALGESPRSAEELATDTRTHAGALARTLRVLSAEGIFEARDDAWGHTPASRLLRSDHPQSMRSFVRMIGLGGPAEENHLWGAPGIHGELRKLGIVVSERTVSRYLAGRPRRPSQTWHTFLAKPRPIHVPGVRAEGGGGRT